MMMHTKTVIKIGMLNLCLGLKFKIDLVKNILLEKEFDILLMQEIEIEKDFDCELLNIPGYS
jgi:exonuclease III